MRSTARHTGRGVAGFIVLSLFSGCSTQHYRASADREAYGAIQNKTWQVENMDPAFTIEHTNVFTLEGLPRREAVEEFLGTESEAERGAAVITLDHALDLAVKHSRSYQGNKEDLFGAALGLTLARHRFAPLFSGTANADVSPATLSREVNRLVDGTNRVEVVTLSAPEVRSSGLIKVDWLLRDLGRIAASFQADFSRLLTAGGWGGVHSELVATFSRPLLRNSRYQEEQEALWQSERNLLYEIRNFTQFRKTFSVEVATAYYGVLGDRDQARNAYMNLLSSRTAAERARALALEGRSTQSDLGRFEQQLLTVENGWIGAVRNYRRSLDNFKMRLGIPVNANVVLDDQELERLTIRHPEIAADDAIRVALVARLDYHNQRDQFDDTARQVDLAVEAFKAQLDLSGRAAIRSTDNPAKGFPLPDPEALDWSAGLILDLPLDRKAERNRYRTALIARDRSSRALDELRDRIQLEVRDSWRALEQARRSYEISEVSVKLAERRVEEQNLLAEFGRARAQDQIDAQNDLIASRNQRTQALVGHTAARLQFWNNLGVLYIKDNGQWEERDHANAQ